MAIVLQRDEDRRWLLGRATGELALPEVTHFLRTARADISVRMWPLLFDARGCQTAMTMADVPAAVAIVRAVIEQKQQRAHAALVADQDPLYDWFLEYETQCAAIGVRLIRVFRELDEGRQWLEIVSAGRNLAT